MKNKIDLLMKLTGIFFILLVFSCKKDKDPITIVTGPDLEITALSAPSAIEPDVYMHITATVRNNGDSTARSSIGFYISEDANDISSAVLLKVTLPYGIGEEFAPDTTMELDNENISPKPQVPVSISPGNYFLVGKIDYNDNISETNEDNNTFAVPIKITGTGSDDPNVVDYLGNVGLMSNMVVSGDGTIYIAYDATDKIDAFTEVHFTRLAVSNDNGSNWSLSTAISREIASGMENPPYGTHASLVVEGTILSMGLEYNPAFSDYGQTESAHFQKSTDGGVNWSNIKKIKNGGTQGAGGPNQLMYHNGKYYFVYQRYHSPAGLKLAESTDGTGSWDVTSITGENNRTYIGALIHSNTFYVAYSNGGYSNQKQVAVATKSVTGGSWTKTNIESNLGTGYPTPAIAHNASNVFVAYRSTAKKKLRCATWNGSIWTIEDVASCDDDLYGGKVSIVEDGGTIYITYYDVVNKDLKFARKVASGAWEIGTIDAADDVGKTSCIVVVGGRIYVSYEDSTWGNLKFATSTGNGNEWL
jgi:hypothetical protein